MILCLCVHRSMSSSLCVCVCRGGWGSVSVYHWGGVGGAGIAQGGDLSQYIIVFLCLCHSAKSAGVRLHKHAYTLRMW